jgi:outer membrane protein
MQRFLVIIMLLLFSSGALAAEKEAKIGYVNLQQALNASVYGKKAKSEIEDVIREKQSMIRSRVEKHEQAKKELEIQSATLSEEALRQRMTELEKEEREIERLITDSNAALQKVQREREFEILTELDGIIDGIGEQGAFTLILPSEVVLYAAEGMDLTEKVIEKYDDMKSSAAPEKKE